MAHVREGFRIRKARKDYGITQTALAKELGISVSYLNLIEHNKRSIGGRLLSNIARILGVDLSQLTGYGDTRLIQDLTNLSGDALFLGLAMEPHGAQDIIDREPGWGRALLRLHSGYIEANKMVEALSDRLNHDRFLVELSHKILSQITSVRSFAEILNEIDDLPEATRQRYISLLAGVSSALGTTAKKLFAFMDEVDMTARPTTPAGEVEDFFIGKQNHFPMLEQAAEALRPRIEVSGEINELALTNYLSKQHKAMLKRVAPTEETGIASSSLTPTPSPTDYQLVDGHLVMQAWHQPETVRFLIAQFIFEGEYADMLDSLVANEQLSSDDARQRARRALARYGAGALLFPYESFLEMAEAVRYDIQVLQQRFGGSFEQICHRLVTLQRSGSHGVPFLYLRADPAGNISKRFSLPNLRLPRHGSACPLWALYRAFLSPNQIVSQRVQLPDEQEFLFVARTVDKQAKAYGTADNIYSVLIGCDAIYADRLVYGAGREQIQGNLVTKAGINCPLCPRPQCAHRAHAPILPVLN